MNALEAIVKEIDEKLTQLRNHICTGSIGTFEEYQKLCGELRGLLFAKDYTISLQKNLEEN